MTIPPNSNKWLFHKHGGLTTSRRSPARFAAAAVPPIAPPADQSSHLRYAALTECSLIAAGTANRIFLTKHYDENLACLLLPTNCSNWIDCYSDAVVGRG